MRYALSEEIAPDAVHVSVTGDSRRLPRSLARFAAARVELNVPATTLARAMQSHPGPAVVGWGSDDAGEILFLTIRTPPWNLVVSELEPQHARDLAMLWLPADPDVPGVVGPPDAVRAFAEAWSELTASTWRTAAHEALHLLEHVRPPAHPPPGLLRVASEDDRELLLEWELAFQEEARSGPGDAFEAARVVDRRLASRRQLLWEDGGTACMVGLNELVGGTVRIGPVYTPPDRRRRGYASVAVAVASQRALDAGAERCMLFTDLANPTSNKIYAAIGYRRHCDWDEIAFER